MRRAIRLLASAGALLVAAGLLTLIFWSDGMATDGRDRDSPAASIALAALGDSSSAAYQDPVNFPPGSGDRGGALRARTFQWTEVLDRLRHDEIDQGPRLRWGRPGVVARARELILLEGGRSPEKEDFLYNFANSGATCRSLMETRNRQVPRLVALMDRDPQRWHDGVVVIRVGTIDYLGVLDDSARTPAGPALRAAADYCAGELARAIAAIQARHPSTRIVIVGIAGEDLDPFQNDNFRSAAATANIKASLDYFNSAFRALTTGKPNLTFFDDRALLLQLVGPRRADGTPDYKPITLGEGLTITNTVGDEPHNTVLLDDHNGLVMNALWAQALVAKLREAFGMRLTPISDEELVRFLAPLMGPPKGG